MNLRSAMTLLPELRDGRAITELSEHIHKAIAAVRAHGKSAKITLEITIAPLKGGAEKFVEAPITFKAEVESKLPQPDAEETLMFVDVDGNPTRNPSERQKSLGLNVAGHQDSKTAT